MRKTKTLYSILIFLSTIFLSISISSAFSITEGSTVSLDSLPDYILDQSQEQHSDYSNVHSYIWLAQSFKPSMTPLTKIEIKIEKISIIQAPLTVSIRKDLNGPDLTSIIILADDVPFFSHWIECDFSDIEVEINETYYIVVRTSSGSGQSYHWFEMHNTSEDIYTDGEQWYSNTAGSEWSSTSSSTYFIDATFRTYSYKGYVDLISDGSFNWTEIQPGEIVTGSFSVANNGTPLSYLNWEIYQWPSWGTWTFSQSSGVALTPEEGPQIIQVNVEAPHTNVPDTYTGKITIINSDNPDDYEVIDAIMITPKSKSMHTFLFRELLNNFFLSKYHFHTRFF